jgi:hypothetical protein
MDNLPIHEDRNRGVFVKGLKEVYVASEAEVHDLIKLGDQSRSVASTSRLSFYEFITSYPTSIYRYE